MNSLALAQVVDEINRGICGIDTDISPTLEDFGACFNPILHAEEEYYSSERLYSVTKYKEYKKNYRKYIEKLRKNKS